MTYRFWAGNIMASCCLGIFHYLNFSEIRYMKMDIIHRDWKKLFRMTNGKQR